MSRAMDDLVSGDMISPTPLLRLHQETIDKLLIALLDGPLQAEIHIEGSGYSDPDSIALFDILVPRPNKPAICFRLKLPL